MKTKTSSQPEWKGKLKPKDVVQKETENQEKLFKEKQKQKEVAKVKTKLKPE